MAQTFITISATPSADVATNGTIVFNYPTGYAKTDFAQSGEKLIVYGLGNDLDQAADTFTLAYGASSVTATYKDATSIPAGTEVVIQLPLTTYEDIGALTDNSGGTASATIAAISATPTQAEVANAIASLAATCNSLVAQVNQLKSDLRSQNLVPK